MIHRLVGPLVLGALLLLGGCDDDADTGPGPVGPVGPTGIAIDGEDAIEGSGTTSSEARTVSNFTVVALDGEGTVLVTAGSEDGLTIEADDNLLTYLESNVEGSELRIATRDGIDIDPTEAPVYRVTVRELTGIRLGGAGAITAGAWAGDSFAITVTGAGDVTVGPLSVGSLSVDVGGVATVTVSGTAGSQDVTIGGVGEYVAADLESQTAVVNARGTGVGTVWAVETLGAEVSDGARLFYYGTPSVESELSDLGTVEALGPR